MDHAPEKAALIWMGAGRSLTGIPFRTNADAVYGATLTLASLREARSKTRVSSQRRRRSETEHQPAPSTGNSCALEERR